MKTSRRPAKEAASAWAPETEEESKREDCLRARQMKRVLPKRRGWLDFGDVLWLAKQRLPHVVYPPLPPRRIRRLIAKLERGVLKGFPAQTLASSFNMHVIRLAVIEALLRALQKYPDDELRTFTLMNKKWEFTPQELEEISAAVIKNRLRSHLNLAGITTMPGFLVCFLHGEFEPTSGKLILHMHGVTTKEKAAALDRLKERNWGYVKTSTGAAPIRCVKVRDREQQFSYLLKSYWPMKGVRIINGKKRRDRKAKRISEPYHTQYLLWLDRQKLQDLTTFNNCWSPRNGGSAAMRRFYLSIQGR